MVKASESVSTEVPYAQSADPFAFDGVLSEDEAAAKNEATDASDDSTDATDHQIVEGEPEQERHGADAVHVGDRKDVGRQENIEPFGTGDSGRGS